MVLLHNLKSIFHVLIIFQCLVFSVYLLSSKTKRPGRNLLALFLIAIGFGEIGGIFLHFLDLRQFLIAHAPYVLYIHYPFVFAAAPLLYLFIASVVRKDFRFKPLQALHFLPALFLTGLVFFRYHVQSIATMRRIVEAGGPFSDPEYLAVNIAFFVQWLAYGLACFALLRSYRSSLKDYLSTIEPWSLSWLNFLLTAVLITRSLEGVEYGLWYVTQDVRVVPLYYAAQVVFLVFLTVLFFRAIEIAPAFRGIVETIAPKPKYEKTLLAEAQRTEYARAVETFMAAEKPFLDPLLSLGDLSKKVRIPSHYLSQVINSHFGMNFFDFINSYRIREAQRLLGDKADGRRTVLDVLLESGFNSKSVFNTAFKKHAGMTPSEYRRSAGSLSSRVA